MTEAATTRYWCHNCEQTIEEAMTEEIKCPFCDSEFIEEMGLTSRWSEQDLSGRGAFDNPFEQTEALRDSDDEEDDLGREFEGFITRHQQVSGIRQLLDMVQDDIGADRERNNSVLINAFNQALALQGSVLDPDGVQGDQGSSTNDEPLIEENVLRTGLRSLLQHLVAIANNPYRYGTPPAKKEVVEALPTVKIMEEVVSCSVCLDDLELGTLAKQMPCGHKFHSPCILPWLQLHSSCPVCRFELPSEDTEDLNEPSDIEITDSGHEEVSDGPGIENESRSRADGTRIENESSSRADGLGIENENSSRAGGTGIENETNSRAGGTGIENETSTRADHPGNGNESSNRAWGLVPWFNSLFSTPEPQTARGAFANPPLPSASGPNLNAGAS